MLKIIKEKKLNESKIFGELSNTIMNVLDKAENSFKNDELSAEEFEELLQGAVDQIKSFADERGILVESKLNEDKDSLVKALKILFDNSTLNNVKKVAQAKQLATSLGIDEKELIKESKELNEATNAYVVVRDQYVKSSTEHNYLSATFDKSDAALFTEYEDAIDAMEQINKSAFVDGKEEFTIRKFDE